MKKIAGIVLAGGLSRRFGSPKAFAQIGTEYFYERAIDALKPHCEQIVIVTSPELQNRFQVEADVITDLPEIAGLGPLAGILSGMDYIAADYYIVMSCDMPYVTTNVIEKLMMLHKTEVTAVVAAGRYHPLVSIWNLALRDVLKDALQRNRLSVMKLLAEVEVAWIDGSQFTGNQQLMFMNVNSPADLKGR